MTMPNVRTETHAPPPPAPQLLDDAFEAELERMALAVNEPDVAPPLESARSGGLWRYALYQLRDFAKYRGSVMFAVALVAIWIFHHNFADIVAGDSQLREAENPFSFLTILAACALGTLGTLFSTAGIVSRDREGGYQRFLFAKPVRVARFYVQSFAINGAGLLAVAALTLLMTSLVFPYAVPLLAPLLIIATLYVTVGGLAFLLSTLVRYEVVIALLLVPVSILLREAAADGYWWAAAVSWMLPPLQRLVAFVPGFPNEANPAHTAGAMAQAVATLAAYGAAYIAAGVAILRKRSIIR